MGVLATVDEDGKPYTRTVAIREISGEDVLFFTQQGSKKVAHLENNNFVSLTMMLADSMRQISFRGQVSALSNEVNGVKYY